METIVTIVLFTILGICMFGLLTCFVALGIIYLSEYNKLFFKLYLCFFDRDEYKLYKEVKNIFKHGGTIPIYSSFIKTNDIKGIYFIVHENRISLWKNQKPVFVDFHKFILDELVELGNLNADILAIREADKEKRIRLEKSIAELEKKIAEHKEKLEKLGVNADEFNIKNNI